LGERPIGTISGYLKNSELKEYSDDDDVPSEKYMYEKNLEDYEFIIREIRNFLDTDGIDNSTVNFLEDLMSKMEKDAWMIRSHLI
jgi:DNA-binding ferritin-like protein